MSDTWFAGNPGTEGEQAGWLVRLRDENTQQTVSVGLLRRRLAEALERTRRAEAQAAAAMAEARRYKRRLDELTAAR